MKAIEQYFQVFIMLYKVVLTFKSVEKNPSVWPFKWKLLSILYKVALTFKSVEKTLVCDHSIESYGAVLSCGVVYDAVQGGSNFLACEQSPSEDGKSASAKQKNERSDQGFVQAHREHVYRLTLDKKF